MAISEKIVHRLPLFCALAGAKAGEALSLAHLAAVIAGKGAESSRSLFSAARGKKILFINQIEDEAAFDQACELVCLLPRQFRSGLYRIIAGSVKRDMLREI
jgi:probable selenium-dependent hydroxylase accessory protein YqeC